ncbi:hypothetical protein HDU96_004430 [Phlyctochytrium bullatum]|nr:hypothetical protein HDU96_004430 [Phlyctochytrium bullatum]
MATGTAGPVTNLLLEKAGLSLQADSRTVRASAAAFTGTRALAPAVIILRHSQILSPIRKDAVLSTILRIAPHRPDAQVYMDGGVHLIEADGKDGIQNQIIITTTTKKTHATPSAIVINMGENRPANGSTGAPNEMTAKTATTGRSLGAEIQKDQADGVDADNAKTEDGDAPEGVPLEDTSEKPSYADLTEGVTPEQAKELNRLAQKVKLAMALVAMKHLERGMSENNVTREALFKHEADEEMNGFEKAKAEFEHYLTVACGVKTESKLYKDMMLTVDTDLDPEKVPRVIHRPSRASIPNYTDKELGIESRRRSNVARSADRDRLKDIIAWRHDDTGAPVYSRGITMIDIESELAMPQVPVLFPNGHRRDLDEKQEDWAVDEEELLRRLEETAAAAAQKEAEELAQQQQALAGIRRRTRSPKKKRKESAKKTILPPITLERNTREKSSRAQLAVNKQSLDQRVLTPHIFDGSILASDPSASAAAAAAAAAIKNMYIVRAAKRRLAPSSVFFLLNPHVNPHLHSTMHAAHHCCHDNDNSGYNAEEDEDILEHIATVNNPGLKPHPLAFSRTASPFPKLIGPASPPRKLQPYHLRSRRNPRRTETDDESSVDERPRSNSDLPGNHEACQTRYEASIRPTKPYRSKSLEATNDPKRVTGSSSALSEGGHDEDVGHRVTFVDGYAAEDGRNGGKLSARSSALSLYPIHKYDVNEHTIRSAPQGVFLNHSNSFPKLPNIRRRGRTASHDGSQDLVLRNASDTGDGEAPSTRDDDLWTSSSGHLGNGEDAGNPESPTTTPVPRGGREDEEEEGTSHEDEERRSRAGRPDGGTEPMPDRARSSSMGSIGTRQAGTRRTAAPGAKTQRRKVTQSLDSGTTRRKQPSEGAGLGLSTSQSNASVKEASQTDPAAPPTLLHARSASEGNMVAIPAEGFKVNVVGGPSGVDGVAFPKQQQKGDLIFLYDMGGATHPRPDNFKLVGTRAPISPLPPQELVILKRRHLSNLHHPPRFVPDPSTAAVVPTAGHEAPPLPTIAGVGLDLSVGPAMVASTHLQGLAVSALQSALQFGPGPAVPPPGGVSARLSLLVGRVSEVKSGRVSECTVRLSVASAASTNGPRSSVADGRASITRGTPLSAAAAAAAGLGVAGGAANLSRQSSRASAASRGSRTERHRGAGGEGGGTEAEGDAGLDADWGGGDARGDDGGHRVVEEVGD